IEETKKSGGAFSTGKAPKAWLTSAAKQWMTRLPDSRGLHDLSIPGTHDSGAQSGGIAVQTQSWTIAEQLSAGVRYFDVRVRRTKTSFAIHHGPVYLKMMFGDIMNAMTAFLRANPKEVILMRVKNEHTAQKGSNSFTSIWNGYMKRYGRYMYTGGAARPTLGQARGKIVVLRNNNGIPPNYGIRYGGSGMDIQDKYKVYFLAHKMNSREKVSLPSKKDVAKKQVLMARTFAKNKFVLNHLSGAVGMAPKDVARSVNRETYKFIGAYRKKSRLGVIIMDYPGEQMVYRIVKTNFSFNATCKKRTYRSVSAKTWVEFRLPQSKSGTKIKIPGGAKNKYVFPKCNRVHWSNLEFLCGSTGQWQRIKGSWDADALCHGKVPKSKYVKAGNR
ncbi:unnamed protein product, partial [Discosporangium mesarthrocarpum]